MTSAPTYTNSFGVTSTVKQRQDFQLNKVLIKFHGWVIDPKFRYYLYVWTSNATMGQGAQTVVAGNLRYIFNKHFTLGAGINGLPGVRSVEGNFPYWLPVDNRQIADEFFRPSYTTGIWGMGEITSKLKYQAMIGNNLSQLGVNANQLPNHFNTIATALVWMPTTGEFGAGFGDYENHATVGYPPGSPLTVEAMKTSRASRTPRISKTPKFGSRTVRSSSRQTSSVRALRLQTLTTK